MPLYGTTSIQKSPLGSLLMVIKATLKHLARLYRSSTRAAEAANPSYNRGLQANERELAVPPSLALLAVGIDDSLFA